jgi:ceramide glucosyltransferase
VTAASLLSSAAAAWWLCSTAVLLLSSIAALVHPARRRTREIDNRTPRLSAIVPVKALHAGFAEAQRSLLAQDYPGLEILVTAQDANSPALAVVRDLHERVNPRIVLSEWTGAASPKLNNLWPAICRAENDVVLTKDSNILLHQGDIAAFVECLGPKVGLVSAIPIARQLLSFPAWIEASIINGYHARVLMLGDAAGLGFGLGKIMLFRRSDLLRAGGFDCLKWAVGEDMAIARAIRLLGLRTVLADRLCDQALGARSFVDVWQRQLRWMTIWRVQLPAVFVVDLLGSALPTAFAGAVAAHLIGMAPLTAFAVTFLGWCGIEWALCAIKRWPVSLWSPAAFLVRELLTPALWFRALMRNDVRWAGADYRVYSNRTWHPADLRPKRNDFAPGRPE